MNVSTILTLSSLDEIAASYHLSPDNPPLLPNPDQFIHNPPEGYSGVYLHLLKAGLRFPIPDFIKALLVHYKIHAIQLTPNGFRKAMCFTLLCKLLDVPPTVDLFRHFYMASPSGNWLSFSKRAGVTELCLGLPSSVKHWKGEFFFLKSSVYPDSVVLGRLGTRSSDRPRALSPEEQVLADRLADNVVWWRDPDETTLALGGLSPYWESLNPRPSFVTEGREISLSDRLVFHRDMRSGDIVGVSSGTGTASSTSLDSSTKSVPEEDTSMKPPKVISQSSSTASRTKVHKRPSSKSSSIKEGGADSSVLQTPLQQNVSESSESDKPSKRPCLSTGIPRSKPLSTLHECPVTSDPLLEVISGISQPTSDPPSTAAAGSQHIPKDKEGRESEAFQDFLNSPPLSPSKSKLPVAPGDSSQAPPNVFPKHPTDFDPAKSAFHKSLFVLGAGNPSADLGVRPLSPVMSAADASPTVEGKAAEVPSIETSGTFFFGSVPPLLLFSYLVD